MLSARAARGGCGAAVYPELIHAPGLPEAASGYELCRSYPPRTWAKIQSLQLAYGMQSAAARAA